MANFSLEKARARSKVFNEALENEIMSDPEARSLYERRRREIELAIALREVREKAHVTQEDLATRLHTTKSAISRLESCSTARHTPSLDTLLKYVHALGYDLTFKLTPLKHLIHAE
jgi:DNA-binding XRE family transcriptional regulator